MKTRIFVIVMAAVLVTSFSYAVDKGKIAP